MTARVHASSVAYVFRSQVVTYMEDRQLVRRRCYRDGLQTPQHNSCTRTRWSTRCQDVLKKWNQTKQRPHLERTDFQQVRRLDQLQRPPAQADRLGCLIEHMLKQPALHAALAGEAARTAEIWEILHADTCVKQQSHREEEPRDPR